MPPDDDAAHTPAPDASDTGTPTATPPPGDTALADGPVFAEPWEAQAFALVESLREGGLFTAAEWSETLGRALDAQSVARGGTDYYACWLAALEGLLAERDVVSADELDATAAAWSRAAHATPHGQPILLANDPEGGPSRST